MHTRSLLASLLIALAAFAASAQDKPAAAPRLNRFIELMEAKKPAFGVFSSIVSTRNGAAMAASGLDFVIVDLEHTPFDLSKLEGYLLGMVNKAEILKKGNLQPSVVPFVRVPAAGREQLQFVIKQVLDLGPMGIVVPHVDTAKDALAMVQASRYPQLQGAPDREPIGKRGVGGMFLGPSDLAFSLGVPLGDPAVETAIEKVLAVSKRTGVPLGTLCGTNEVEKRLAQGFRFLAVGGDSGPSPTRSTLATPTAPSATCPLNKSLSPVATSLPPLPSPPPPPAISAQPSIVICARSTLPPDDAGHHYGQDFDHS